MKYRLTILIVFILSLNLCQITLSQSQPKAWYVYKNATGLNNGTSWQNAWTSFSAVDWNAMQDGDTLYISGSLDSVVYNAGITINRNNVTITKGKSAGHNGRAILKAPITGQGIAVYLDEKKNITIDGLEFVNFSRGVYCRSRTTWGVENIFIKNCKMYYTVDTITANQDVEFFGTDHGGTSDTTFFNRFRNIHIVNNEYISPNWSNNQINMVAATNSWNVYVVGNKFINRNQNPVTHDDWFVANATHSYILKNYYMEATNKARFGQWGNANGIGGGEKAGNNVIAFNLMIKGDSVGNPQIMDFYKPISQPNSFRRRWEKMIVVNNTFVGGQKMIREGADNNAYIINNIFYRVPQSPQVGGTVISQDEGDLPIIDSIRYNSFINFNSRADLLWVIGTTNNNQIHPSNYQISTSNSSLWYSPFTSGLVAWRYGNPIPEPTAFIPDTTKPYYINGASLSDILQRVQDDNIKEGTTSWFEYYWDNGKDYFGNPFLGKVGAIQLGNATFIDNDPPEVVSAQILDSVTVRVVFSEPLEESSASNPNNYAIDNGININSVQFSGFVATLNTSVHSPGFYNLTVSNVTDTAGNIISAQNNSAAYGYNPEPINQLLKFVPGRTNASSIPEPEHRPEKTFDGLVYNSGDPTSRWAGQYLPQWIGYDLNDVRMLSKVRIQFYNWQNGRIYNYSIQVSTDSINWVSVKSNVLSQLSEWTEETFEPIPARYIRIIVHSNNQNDWASIWEAEFYGQLMVSNYDDQKNIPTVFALNQNYPNPFNPSTTISWQSPVSGWQTLKVYDMLGNEVVTLVDEYREAGSYNLQFTINNLQLTSGVYFYQLRINDPSTSSGSGQAKQSFVETKKMILLK